MIVHLGAADLTLADGGGKAANLSRLARGGFPVPPGFVVTTHACQCFLEHNTLTGWVLDTAQRADLATPAEIDKIAAAIHARFMAGALPPDLATTIVDAYNRLGVAAVAVRSSATTEDLPELSFAGQHDSFLNVVDADALLLHLVKCWSSVWTARAISYRLRNAVAHKEAAVAVIVQAMVQSEAAGVLFTANPLTGRRTETVIDAAPGLGEALVSGRLEPDHFVVNSFTGRILKRSIAPRTISIRSAPSGGTTVVEESACLEPSLSDQSVAALTALGQRVANEFQTPQDIEWAEVAGGLWLLQARPITSLFPVPAGMPPDPLRVLASLGAMQGMLDPFTPLGRDMFRNGAAMARTAIGVRETTDTQGVFIVAGDRLFLDVTTALCDLRVRRVVRRALDFIEPEIGRALDEVLDDPRLIAKRIRPTFAALRALSPVWLRLFGNATLALLWPSAARARVERRVEQAIARLRRNSVKARTLAERLALFEGTVQGVRDFGPVVAPGVAVGLGALAALHRLTKSLPDGAARVLAVTRGLPHNVTTEMDLALWAASREIAANAQASHCFATLDSAALARDALARTLPTAGQDVVDRFLARYGTRGVAEIDIGRPRWREDPTLLMHSLKSYLTIQDGERAPDRVFSRGKAEAEQAIEALATAVRRGRHGWLRARLVRIAAHRVRALAGLRESPKFGVVRLFGIVREGMLASGQELVRAGRLERAGDVFFLSLEDLHALARGEQRDWWAIVDARRTAYARELRRRQVPILLLTDGHAFVDRAPGAVVSHGEVLSGTPVSAGIAEGTVKIIFDPHTESLAPGEILVCPGTDPAWTPLFLSAGGVVLEVGGLMTHGSVVAREYGIPAVVGVRGATTRLQSGQRIRIDGTHGTIVVLPD